MSVMVDGTAHVTHPSGARAVINSEEWSRIQHNRMVLANQHSKNVADQWYVQVLDLYALMVYTT